MNNTSSFIDGLIPITDEEFKKISRLVYERFGINLTDKKKSLVMGRLNKLIKSLDLKNFNEYYDLIINDKTGQALLSLVDKISTNHSFFFREKDHFDYLKNSLLPELADKLKTKDIRIWCAGCAQGEEAYTLAMILNEFFESYRDWEIGLLATDISITALDTAKKGVYPVDKIKEVPVSIKHKYFKQQNGNIIINDKLKQNVLFKRLNFINNDFPFKEKFHIIFCRNVMIYFDKNTRGDLVNKFYNYLYDDGYLFVGHSESLDRKICPLEYIRPTVYKKVCCN